MTQPTSAGNFPASIGDAGGGEGLAVTSLLLTRQVAPGLGVQERCVSDAAAKRLIHNKSSVISMTRVARRTFDDPPRRRAAALVEDAGAQRRQAAARLLHGAPERGADGSCDLRRGLGLRVGDQGERDGGATPVGRCYDAALHGAARHFGAEVTASPLGGIIMNRGDVKLNSCTPGQGGDHGDQEGRASAVRLPPQVLPCKQTVFK